MVVNAPCHVSMGRGEREQVLERWLVAELAAARRGGRPRVVRPAAEAAAALAAAGRRAAAGEAAAALTTAGTLGLGDLRGRVAQRGADLVDFELDDRALLAFLGLVGPLAQPALHDDPGAALERLGDVLRGLAPDAAAQEQRVAVLPLVRVLVQETRRRRDGEVGDRG